MSKNDSKSVEKKWQKMWENQNWFKATDNDKKKKKMYVLVEFPYPSGYGLHIGHAFTMTGADIYARKKRMSGFNVLFPMGWDAFGLPTENYAIKTGVHPSVATKKNTDKFREQMKELAFSFDWDREVNTTNPRYYKWTQWIFIKLFEKGLAYKEEKPINWCPSCKIGLANEEVVNGNCERCGAEATRRNISQWIVKITDYADRLIDGLKKTEFIEKVKAAQINWIDRSEGVNIKFKVDGPKSSIKELETFTTRADTLFGVTFIVIAPEHPFVSQLGNKEIKDYVVQSRKKSELERSELQKDKTGVFTGVYLINPANNKKIPLYVADYVLESYGTGVVMGVPAHDQRDWEFAKKYGLEIIPVIEQKKKWDYESGAMTGVDEGKMVNSGFLNGLEVKEAIKKANNWVAENSIGKKTVSYHLRDWIFSRQHYWGEPIPMVKCPKCGWVPVPEDQLPIELPRVEKYQPTDTGESPLANIDEWVNTTCPKCKGKAKRETDTMPNWAGSDWYYLRYLDNKNDKEIADMAKQEYWMPVDVYIGGDEHNTLHLLYSRFIYQFLHDIGAVPKSIPEPYFKRLSHGVILGPDGQRMSKSRGNVIIPADVCGKYGVDVTRAYLMFMGPFEGTMIWNDNALKGVDRFIKRFYNFVKEIKGKESSKEVKVVVNKLIKKVSDQLDTCQFNTAIAATMEALNSLESKEKETGVEEAKKMVQILAPITPYTCEELWQILGEKDSVHASSWPKVDSQYLTEDEVEIAVQINGKVKATVNIPSSDVEDRKKVEETVKGDKKITEILKDKQVIKTIVVPGRLVNFVVR